MERQRMTLKAVRTLLCEGCNVEEIAAYFRVKEFAVRMMMGKLLHDA